MCGAVKTTNVQLLPFIPLNSLDLLGERERGVEDAHVLVVGLDGSLSGVTGGGSAGGGRDDELKLVVVS